MELHRRHPKINIHVARAANLLHIIRLRREATPRFLDRRRHAEQLARARHGHRDQRQIHAPRQDAHLQFHRISKKVPRLDGRHRMDGQLPFMGILKSKRNQKLLNRVRVR